MAFQLRPPALPSPPFELTVKLWDTSSSFCSTAGQNATPTMCRGVRTHISTEPRYCTWKVKPNNSSAARRDRKGHETRQTSDVRQKSGCCRVTEGRTLGHPLVKECAKRASEILFTPLYFSILYLALFLSSPPHYTCLQTRRTRSKRETMDK